MQRSHFTKFRREGQPTTKWIDVSRHAPCPICEKESWCSVADDGSAAKCRRQEVPTKATVGKVLIKKDKSGANYFVHPLTEKKLATSSHPQGRNNSDKSSLPNAPTNETHRADADTLNHAYQILLAELPLSIDDRKRLVARGLSPEEIDRRGYGTLPSDDESGTEERRRAARALAAERPDSAKLVPGISGRPLAVRGPAGLLIPVRDTAGRIVALKVRREVAPDRGPRYVYLSSKKIGGSSPGAPVHVPVGVAGPCEEVRVTEGELKADVAMCLSKLPTISIPGVASWRACIPVLRELKTRRVRLAFDADARTNPMVASQLRDAFCGLKQEGHEVTLETWAAENGKGIDDLLSAGLRATESSGEAASTAVRDICALVGVPEHATESEKVVARLLEKLDSGGPQAMYADAELLNDVARTSHRDPAAYASLKEDLRKADVRMTDFDRVMKARVPEITASLSPQQLHGRPDEFFVDDESQCICRKRFFPHGPAKVPVCNFVARIVDETQHDDGLERRVVLGVEGRLSSGRLLPRIEVAAEQFSRPEQWVVPQWGSDAIVWPGESRSLPAAIQSLSENKTRRVVYGHVGWRNIEGTWSYLHADGAVGPEGCQQSITVDLPTSLRHYKLPETAEDDDLLRAVRASLGFLRVAPEWITFPLLAAVYRAVLGPVDLSLFLVGASGSFKSELTALQQQHFGAGFSRTSLPGNWASTANALEAMAFVAKDAVFVIDDFAPGGAPQDVARLHREAQRVLRAQGNQTGRNRLTAEASLRPERHPRGMIVSSGEDLPRGHSIRARTFVVEVERSDISVERLTQCQHDAGAGLYAQSLAGFLRWLAPHYEAMRESWRPRIEKLRRTAQNAAQHARMPGNVAELFVGFETFLRFACEVGAITSDDADGLRGRCWRALDQAVARQTNEQDTEEPAQQFVRLLTSLLATRRVHLASKCGQVPDDMPGAWGWEKLTPGQTTGGEDDRWRPNGKQIGWIDGRDVYLDPEASYAEVQRFAQEQGASLAVSATTLRKRLNEHGHLKSIDKPRKTLTVRRMLHGRQHKVLHFDVATLAGEDERFGETPDIEHARSAETSDILSGSDNREPGANCPAFLGSVASNVGIVRSDSGEGARCDASPAR